MSENKTITLYKRNAKNQPIFWKATILGNKIELNFGIVGKTGAFSKYIPPRGVEKEWKTIVNAKRREGGVELSELYDNAPAEITNEQMLINYLNTYLPKYNTTNEGFVLPQLAKIYEFDRNESYLAQAKINGVRCNISVIEKNTGLFGSLGLVFHSRKSLEYKCSYLELYLIDVIGQTRLKQMYDNNIVLDGELYIPGVELNEILSAVENASNPLNRLLQFWCYDLAIEDMVQSDRLSYIHKEFRNHLIPNYNNVKSLKDFHFNNKKRLVILNNYTTDSDDNIINFRNMFVESGFEGVILRNPNSFYQFGKRNTAMFKCKPIMDGYFKILDIVSEGAKRPEFSKFILRNDINEEQFECMPIGSADIRKSYLTNKEQHIGKLAFVEYRTRSGVKEVPAHGNVIEIKL